MSEELKADSMGSCWPEQEAVIKWWEKHSFELKESVSRERIKIQEELAAANAQIRELKKMPADGKIIDIHAFSLRPIDGHGAPRYLLRLDIEYGSLAERDEAAAILRKHGEE